MYRKNKNTFYCFSPPVMLITLIIEFGAALYVLWRYHMSTMTRLVVAMLVSLGAFQAAEFAICGSTVVGTPNFWSRLGYGAITMLPPLGIHLISVIADKARQNRYLITLGYLSAAAFIFYFVFATQAISGQTCYANYAVFDTHAGATTLYSLYYYGWLAVGTFMALFYARKHPKHATALRTLAIGYLSFVLPTVTVNLIDPDTISGIPSIMCGFAVILALLLVGRVSPLLLQPRTKRSKGKP